MTAAGGMKRWADISTCGRYRFRLGRKWSDGRSVCWIMLNPSVADGMIDDPTVRRIIGFSRRWGYGALVAVNLYPVRATSPGDLKIWVLEKNSLLRYNPRVDTLKYNLSIIMDAAHNASLVIAAWGACNPEPMLAEYVIERLGASRIDLRHLGLTAGGHPKHPLARGRHRIPDDAEPRRWEKSE